MKNNSVLKTPLRVVVAQLNFVVGDIEGNAEKIIQVIQHASSVQKADVVVFPEMALSGYPVDDLLLRHDFQQRIAIALNRIIAEVKDVNVILGYPEVLKQEGAECEHDFVPYVLLSKMFNSAAVIHSGAVIANYRKQLLPNYGVFDEKRHFTAGDEPCVITVNGHKLAITICEDLWFKEPLASACALGVDMAISINASPFDMYKQLVREKVMGERARENSVPVLYVNGIGAQDDLVFDGGSFVLNKYGKVIKRIESFMEKTVALDFDIEEALVGQGKGLAGYGSTEQRVYDALVLAVLDYVEKNHFKKVVLGLSGGIDSALTLAIAVDALGADRVVTAFMPSKFSSKMSKEDVVKLAKNFAVEQYTIGIDSLFAKFRRSLKKIFKGFSPNIAEENLQARIRGTLLMALSNKRGWLVLATGNKSELAMGYSTLYGDMVGGFAPLKDVFKTMVYQLAEYRNSLAGFDIIPRRVLDRAPSAELKPDQKDSDTLPPYATLDPVLQRYVENDESVEQIVAAGFEEEMVKGIITVTQHNEYKRSQSVLGPKISVRAFGRDRRYPVTSGF